MTPPWGTLEVTVTVWLDLSSSLGLETVAEQVALAGEASMVTEGWTLGEGSGDGEAVDGGEMLMATGTLLRMGRGVAIGLSLEAVGPSPTGSLAQPDRPSSP